MVSSYNQVFHNVLQQYHVQSKTYASVEKEIAKGVTKIKQAIQKAKINAEVCLGGSAAKGTLLLHDFDCDVFVRFDYATYKDAPLSDLLEKAIQKFKAKRVHGSRDYFQMNMEKISYEIIPVLHVTKSKDAKNVTDMSPLHVTWVKKNARKTTCQEIILAKLFCRAQDVYGAESYINGFSGHVLDILIIQYGSLLDLLKNAAAWKTKTILDPEKHYKNEKEILEKLNAAKVSSPLIIVDPVQPERNAAAALNTEKYVDFITAAKAFLQKPSEEFFIEKKKTEKEITSELKKKFPKATTVFVNLTPHEGKEDIVGTKLLKLFLFIKDELKRHEFNVLESGWHWDRKKKVFFWYTLKTALLPETREHIGPPIAVKKAAIAFQEKHGKRVFERNKRLYANIKREYRTPQQLIKAIAATVYAREKATQIRVN